MGLLDEARETNAAKTAAEAAANANRAAEKGQQYASALTEQYGLDVEFRDVVDVNFAERQRSNWGGDPGWRIASRATTVYRMMVDDAFMAVYMPAGRGGTLVLSLIQPCPRCGRHDGYSEVVTSLGSDYMTGKKPFPVERQDDARRALIDKIGQVIAKPEQCPGCKSGYGDRCGSCERPWTFDTQGGRP